MFSGESYPKSYASSKKKDYRLRDFLELSEEELEKIEGQLWDYIHNKAKKTKALQKFKNLQFLNAGWEWSVFKKDEKTVIKVPSQIFLEVNELKYLENTRKTYQKILKYFPSKYVARTKFYRQEDKNIIEQDFIKGDGSFFVSFNTREYALLNNLVTFLHFSLEMLKNEEWLPDFDIKRMENGFNLRNVIIEEKTFNPKIIDFTAYYDVYRLYPQRTKYEIKEKENHIRNFLKWLGERSR